MKDKIYHIIAGLFIAGWVGVPALLESGNLFAGLWTAFWGGAFAGLVKEWSDSKVDGNKFDWVDFGYTAIGVGIAMVFVIAIHFAKG